MEETAGTEIPILYQQMAFEKFDEFWGCVESFPEDGCWLWTRAKNGVGYGCLTSWYKLCGDGLAHRIAYRMTHGEIPDGMCVCHRCDVPNCVNPAHLFLGTRADNNRDKIEKGRSNWGTRHGNAKLNDAQVREIRGMVSAGFSDGVIASRYEIETETVRRIRLGKGWTRLIGETPISEEIDALPRIFRRLPDDLYERSKEMRDAGMTYRAIAKAIGVSHRSAWVALNGNVGGGDN